ncbi:sulfatase-like hydrolase/transferase [Salinibacter ruber]|uniref:sulfatase-like hydrolase/transferase n=1 Tax=Salinibacter ruber TaxID=146919 RepID=UPI000E584041|nr:sulfatase-like hydrolase/transferase [Salinibacter ruber]
MPDWPGWAVAVGALLGLNVLLQVPALLFGTLPWPISTGYLLDPLRLYYLFSLDLFGLACALALVPYTTDRSPIRMFVVGSVLFLLVYGIYDHAVQDMLHRSPIFYADVSHLVGAAHLLLNLQMPWWHVLGLVGAAAVAVLLTWKLPDLIQYLHLHLRRPPLRRGILAAAAVVSLLVGGAVLGERGVQRMTYRSTCLSTAECVVRNAKASVELSRGLARSSSVPADSTYRRYRALRWDRPPSLYIVVLESYGSVLTAPPHRASYENLMGPVSDSLAASGWHTATAHSRAPVSGGLSWLSVATMLSGTTVEHQPSFDMLRPKLPRYPHLAWALQQQGYTTATLQPPVRKRAGLSVENLYGFDRTFYFEDLGYQGPDYGWGIVPDQYSLAVAHDQFVEQTARPFFLFFEAVSSHFPWTDLPPPLVDDPLLLGNRSPEGRHETGRSPSAGDAASLRERPPVEQLLRQIEYDWRVLTGYLQAEAPSNSLAVVVGDHQPPGIENESSAVPVHVLSRKEDLVRRFEDYGFSEGLQPPAATDTLHHAGLYSMLTRVLTAHSGTRIDSLSALPPYRPQGVEHTALLPTP